MSEEEYAKYIYTLLNALSLGDILLFQDIENRTELIDLIKHFITNGVLETDTTEILFTKKYDGVIRVNK